MSVVALVGFSCAGKSSILRSIGNTNEVDVVTADSDAFISGPYGGHIYNMFLQLGRVGALAEISHREKIFLEEFPPTSRSCLVAAGPFLVCRNPQWQRFVERFRPAVFYLQQTPEEAFDGLNARRNVHAKLPGVAAEELFGCWDEDVTTTYDPAYRAWRLLDREAAVANIRRHMESLDPLYRACAPSVKVVPAKTLRDGSGEAEFTKILAALGRDAGA